MEFGENQYKKPSSQTCIDKYYSFFIRKSTKVITMSKEIRCKSGIHQYDPSKYTICPYCGDATEVLGAPNMKDKNNKQVTGKPLADTMPVDRAKIIKPIPNTNQETEIFHTKSGIQPLTGWLVIVEGPGTGIGLPIVHGINSIGRDSSAEDDLGNSSSDSSEAICMTFAVGADSKISRSGHARLIFDNEENVFYLQHGDGKNITRVNNKPVLESVVLKAFDEIRIGETKMKFIPFCGADFSWPKIIE